MCSVQRTGAIVIFAVAITMCFAHVPTVENEQAVGRKGLKYKWHHLHHNPYFYYLAFLAIKLKFAFVLGTMFILAMFGSKTYALLKYGIMSHMMSKQQPEKVYVQAAPIYQHQHPTYFRDDDHDELHADASDNVPEGSSPYGRRLLDGSHDDHFRSLRELFKRVNLNELAFNALNITQTECKQRFVCEADFQASRDRLLNLEIFLIRDETFEKYRRNEPTNSIEDCTKLCELTA